MVRHQLAARTTTTAVKIELIPAGSRQTLLYFLVAIDGCLTSFRGGTGARFRTHGVHWPSSTGHGLLYTATYAIRIAPPEIVFLVGDVQLQTPFGKPTRRPTSARRNVESQRMGACVA